MTAQPGEVRVTVDADVTPQFTAAFLRVSGGECAFIETHTSHAVPRLMRALADVGKSVHDVRYVVVTHAHLDHAAGAGALLRVCPQATLLAHPRTARHLVDPSKLVKSATAVYGEARFAELYGTVEPIPAERVKALEDGQSFELGRASFRVWHTAGHANHHFVVHDEALDSVYTGDSFGLVYPGLQARGRFALASTSPTGFDAAEARKSLARIVGLKPRLVCLTHFGAFAEVADIAAQVGAWVDRAEAWLDEATASGEPFDALTAKLTRLWKEAVVAEAAERHLGFGEPELRLLALDIELNAKGLASVAVSRREAH